MTHIINCDPLIELAEKKSSSAIAVKVATNGMEQHVYTEFFFDLYLLKLL
jgi:hypothetical protein